MAAISGMYFFTGCSVYEILTCMQIVYFLLGLCVGSFANVLIDRLPNGENVITGRSRCDFCKKTLRWFELIPILSFLIQNGRCRRCRKSLSLQYPVVELACAIGFVVLYLFIPYSLIHLFSYSLIFLSLLVIFVADLKYEIIPDSMIVFGLAGSVFLGHVHWIPALGASGFFLFLWLVTHGRGMGLGDVKLVFLLGLLNGFPAIVIALYIAFLTGAIIGVILMVIGKKKLRSHIPFGPFLIGGSILALVYGNQIMLLWSQLL